MVFDRESLAEQCLLGAAFIDPETARKVAEEMAEEDFADPRHRAIWRAMRFLAPTRSIDLVGVHEHLCDTDEAAMVGGLAYLAGLDVYLPSLAAVPDLVRWVKERSIRRRMEDVVRETLARQGESNVEDVIRVLRESAERFAGELPSAVTAELLCDGAEGVIFGERKERHGIETGLLDLDAKTGGLQPGQLWTVAGRPSVGKSSLAHNVGLAAARAGKRVFLATLEMGRAEITERVVSTLSGVNHEHIRKGSYWGGEEKRIHDAVAELDGLPFWFSDNKSSAQQLINSAEKHKAQHGLDLLIVDYLTLLAPDGKFERRELEVADATRRFKLAARQLECCVLMLSQLNRQTEMRKGGKPMLSDLRESGSVEADSDGAILIWKPETDPPDVVELLVAKNRSGPTGPVKVYFRSRILRFENLARGGEA